MTQRERTQKTTAERRAAALCVGCGSPVADNKWRCSNCTKRKSEHAARRKQDRGANGTCSTCKQPVIVGQKVCERHYFLVRASVRLGTRTMGSAIQKLYQEQQGLCALSGAVLDFTTMELDHIVPKSRGGSDSTDNLRWVTKQMNRLKGDLLDDELYVLCHQLTKNTKDPL